MLKVIFSVIGSNGSGKTTMFNNVLGQIAPDSGQIELSGKNIAGFSPAEPNRCGVGRTFQTPQVFGKTMVRDIGRGRTRASKQHGAALVCLQRFELRRTRVRIDSTVSH